MSIRMAGVDFHTANLDRRGKYALTQTEAAGAMHRIAALPGIRGCILYSTCNRTELWLDAEDSGIDARALLRSLGGKPDSRESEIAQRSGADAVRHLFETACGMRSQIWGEDQILAQVKRALAQAREEQTAGSRLEKLFLLAITAAKRVKSEVRFTMASRSVASAVIDGLRARGGLAGVRCLVIGSGKMGQLMARQLTEAGADVTMTLRQYRYGVSLVPDRCRTIPYDGRLEEIPRAGIVVSATASPHYTVRRGELPHLPPAPDGRDRVFVDLAVPRDIDPAVGETAGCRLMTIDDFACGPETPERKQAAREAEAIIRRYMADFFKWQSLTETLPQINERAAYFSRRLTAKLADLIGDTADGSLSVPPPVRQLIESEAKDLLFSFESSLYEAQKASAGSQA